MLSIEWFFRVGPTTLPMIKEVEGIASITGLYGGDQWCKDRMILTEAVKKQEGFGAVACLLIEKTGAIPIDFHNLRTNIECLKAVH